MKNLKIGDIVIIAVIIIITAGVFFLRFFCFNNGDTVEVVISGSSETYPLNQEKTIEIENNGFVLSVAIKNGCVFVEESTCPNQNCVNFGKISKQGESIACIPAEVFIKIKQKGGEEYDRIVG